MASREKLNTEPEQEDIKRVKQFSSLLKFGSFNIAQHPTPYIDLVWQTLIVPLAYVHSVLMSRVNHFVIIRQSHTPPSRPVTIITQ